MTTGWTDTCPCDGCTFKIECTTQELACKSFALWMDKGKSGPPEPNTRSRTQYKRIFPNEGGFYYDKPAWGLSYVPAPNIGKGPAVPPPNIGSGAALVDNWPTWDDAATGLSE